MIDLSENVAVTTQLLLEPLQWRVRAVESLEIASAERCHRKRSLHCGPLRALVQKVAPIPAGTDTAFLVLNVGAVERSPLLDFDVAGPGGKPAFLLPRPEIAQRELAYLEALLWPAKLLTTGARHYLAAVLQWTRGADWRGDQPPRGTAAYLADGLGFSIGGPSLEVLTALNNDCARILDLYCDRPGLNIAATPIYALPTACDSAGVTTEAEAIELLRSFRDLLESLAAAVDAPQDPAGDFLLSLADYGQSYDMLVAVEVPLDLPFLIKYEESRAIGISLRGETTQDVVIADAISNHVSVRVTDPNVRLRDLVAQHPRSKADAYGTFSVARQDSVWSLYAHGDDRDFQTRLKIRLSSLRRLAAVYYSATLLVTAAIAILWRERPENKDLALLVGPTTFAATILLAREPSTLGSRLRVVPNMLLAVALAAMLASGGYLYLTHHSDEGTKPPPKTVVQSAYR